MLPVCGFLLVQTSLKRWDTVVIPCSSSGYMDELVRTLRVRYWLLWTAFKHKLWLVLQGEWAPRRPHPQSAGFVVICGVFPLSDSSGHCQQPSPSHGAPWRLAVSSWVLCFPRVSCALVSSQLMIFSCFPCLAFVAHTLFHLILLPLLPESCPFCFCCWVQNISSLNLQMTESWFS